VKDAFDEPGGRFIALQWKPGLHFLFEGTEKTHIKALKYVTCVGRESHDFHSMIGQQMQCLRLHVNKTIIHQ
jgi:hypothetical protein